jgi:HK97 family phage major capsid protein
MDEKALEKLNAELAKLGETIDSKLKSYAEKSVDKAEFDRVKDLLKAELETKMKDYLEKNAKLQEQVDALDTAMKRVNAEPKKKGSLKDAIKEVLDEKMLKDLREGRIKSTGDLYLKTVEDMTQANSFESTEVVQAMRVPGIVYDPDRSQRVRDLISTGTTSSNAISYVYEYAYDDATDITAEGSDYKQGAFDLKVASVSVRKITNYIIISEEMLEDVEGLVSYISVRLPSKLKLKEDSQLLYGDGTGINIKGITEYAAAYSDVLADSLINRFDVLMAACNQATIAEYRPTAIVLHPTDAMLLKLEKDSTGQYVFPWVYMNGAVSVDGIPVITTTAMTVGDFLVGDFKLGAQVFDRRQASIEFTNVNEDNFIKGMITVRASERIALAVYRNNAFVYGTFGAALAQGSA